MAAVGRPTKYRPEFCEAVIELGKTGASITEMACKLGVVKSSLWEWEKKFDEFSNALNLARQYSQMWWEKQGQLGLWVDNEGAKINAAIWSRNMAARFPEDWREKRENTNNTTISMADELKQALLNDELDSEGEEEGD